jgi:hypothetical protein
MEEANVDRRRQPTAIARAHTSSAGNLAPFTHPHIWARVRVQRLLLMPTHRLLEIA